MTELWQQCLIREVVNTVGRGEGKKGMPNSGLAKFVFWVHPGSSWP